MKNIYSVGSDIRDNDGDFSAHFSAGVLTRRHLLMQKLFFSLFTKWATDYKISLPSIMNHRLLYMASTKLLIFSFLFSEIHLITVSLYRQTNFSL